MPADYAGHEPPHRPREPHPGRGASHREIRADSSALIPDGEIKDQLKLHLASNREHRLHPGEAARERPEDPRARMRDAMGNALRIDGPPQVVQDGVHPEEKGDPQGDLPRGRGGRDLRLPRAERGRQDDDHQVRPRPHLPGPGTVEIFGQPHLSPKARETAGLPSGESLFLRLPDGPRVPLLLRGPVPPREGRKGGADRLAPQARRPGEGGRAPAPEVLPRHAPAGRAGPGPHQRPVARHPGRTARRARSSRPEGDPGHHRPVQAGGQDGLPVLAHPPGHRDDLRPRGHHRRRPDHQPGHAPRPHLGEGPLHRGDGLRARPGASWPGSARACRSTAGRSSSRSIEEDKVGRVLELVRDEEGEASNPSSPGPRRWRTSSWTW